MPRNLIRYIWLALLIIGIMHAPNNEAHAREQTLDQTSIKAALSQIKKSFDRAEKFMQNTGLSKERIDLRGMPEGEPLLLELILPPRLLVEGIVFGEVHKNTLIISLKDFINTLHFPIEFNSETKQFKGWFVREDKRFEFNMNTGVISSNEQEYVLDDRSKVFKDDVFVPIEDIKLWFEMEIDVDVGIQRLALHPTHPLPATERFERRQKDYTQRRLKPPSMPRYSDPYDLIGLPVVDMNTRTSYRKDSNAESSIKHSATIRTDSEFAYGSLNTNLSFDQENRFSSARVRYLQESEKEDLLGPLNARSFEIGDITPTRLPITGSASPETGFRVTNIDPIVGLNLPSTRIEGYFFPGWDIELYRDNALLTFQETDEEGYYAFENILLLSDRNIFRVVAYGPQGEIREELVSIPFDPNRLANAHGVYDVSLTSQNRQFYRKNESEDKDKDTPHLVGFYETPISNNTTLRVGGRARQEDGRNKLYASTGVSSSYKGALINAGIAADEKGELGSELSVIKEFGTHRARADLRLSTGNFNPGQPESAVQVFSNRYNLEGPINFNLGVNPRYAANVRYDMDSEGETSSSGFLSFNTQLQRFGVNQIFNYSDSSTLDTGPQIGGTTSITGSFGKNIIRGLGRYDAQPEPTLKSLTAFWKRQFSNKLEAQLQVDQTLDDEQRRRYSAQLNWRPKYATITPRLSYDDKGDIEAILSTRFSLARTPESGKLLVTREPLVGAGNLSAFVFLDKNGNLEFDEGDSTIEDAKIVLPHNTGGGSTNEDGIAYITQLRPNLPTDVFVDNGSLPDPFWISAHEGFSIMPRTGHTTNLEFPIHIGGEVDGTVYKKSKNGEKEPASNVSLVLYNESGEPEKTTLSGPDGFYIFSLVPPGRYILLLGGRNFPDGFVRPLPKTIEIGFDGTIIYGNDLLLEEGYPDVPIQVLASLENDKKNTSSTMFLNLGSFHSKLMMNYVWHKALKNSHALAGEHLFSMSDKNNTGKQILRVALPKHSIKSGYQKCQTLAKNGTSCTLEILALQKL